MTFTALTPLPHSTDPAAASAFHTETLDFQLDNSDAYTDYASLRHGSLALRLGPRQATRNAAAVGQAPCR